MMFECGDPGQLGTRLSASAQPAITSFGDRDLYAPLPDCEILRRSHAAALSPDPQGTPEFDS